MLTGPSRPSFLCHMVLCSQIIWIKWHLNSGFCNTINISMVASNTTISNNISNNFICVLSACQSCCSMVEQNNQMQHNKTLQMNRPVCNRKEKKWKRSDKHSTKSSQLIFKAIIQSFTIVTSRLCFKDGQNPAQNFVGIST